MVSDSLCRELLLQVVLRIFRNAPDGFRRDPASPACYLSICQVRPGQNDLFLLLPLVAGRVIDYKTILFAAVQNDLFLSASQDANFNPDLGEAIVGQRFAVEVGEFFEYRAAGLFRRGDSVKCFHAVHFLLDFDFR